MWQLTIVSGKGGTGKTILTASLAALARDKVVADCDVDAPDLHLLLSPQVRESHPFTGLKLARIDPSRCDRGKRCAPVCRFDAIRFPNDGDFFIDRSACEGCGVCERTCHTGAIVMEERVSGEWYVSRTSYGPMVHAQLDPGEETSGRLVAEVRGQAKKIAEQEGLGLVLIDGPPGTGCPVISAMTGAEEVVVVAEPTRSGMHDLERVLDLAEHFGIFAGVVINKYDLNLKNTGEIEQSCRERGVEIHGRIPFDPLVVESLARARPVVEDNEGEAARAIRDISEKLLHGSGRDR